MTRSGVLESPRTPDYSLGLEPTRLVTLRGNGWARRVDWREPTMLGSAAFWVDQARRARTPVTYRVGQTLAEEIAFCLLGGYGIRESMAMAAYVTVRDQGLLGPDQVGSEADFLRALSNPMGVPGHTEPVRYRFPQQKARRLAQALRLLRDQTPPPEDDARAFRDWLTVLPGVGLKTASWIVRNRVCSDDIAVIDIHVRRAGVFAGCFDPMWRLPRDYHRFEEAFVAWAAVGGVPTADLDAYIWSSLSTLGRGARLIFGVEHLTDMD